MNLPLSCLAALLFSLGALEAGPTGAQPAHWAFRPVPESALPREIGARALGPIDAWHQKILAERGLPMAQRAARHTLARRTTFHLHGLPPDHADVEAFANDLSPNAHARQLDRLLASPRYGERWARHWMDVARYADNKGYVFEEERRYAYAYTYRDWLVSAFNSDLPYDAFLIHQLAGDQVARETGNTQAYAALGFLTLGRRFLNREPDIIDDRIDVVTRGMLGLTVACARCHDHKFDPIPTDDYYSLYGVFASSSEPAEKPLLGEPDVSSPVYQEFIRESNARQEKLDAFFRERHAKLRTEPVLKSYFALAHAGRNWEKSRIESRAQGEKLYQRIAVQWRDRIVSLCEAGDPAFVPWAAFARQAEPIQPSDAASLLATIEEGSNTVLWNALQEARIGTMADLIAVYAREIAAANREAPHADADRESLRQLLVSDASPTGLRPERLYRLFNTPDQQAVRRLRRELEAHRAQSPGAPPRGMALVDREKPIEPHVFVRGNPRVPGKQVPRRFLQVLSGEKRQPFTRGSGRHELAQAIASPDNPLTARVFVNRVWMHTFGEALVASPSDFGVRTEEPALSSLLDRLAADFMRDGWSIKRLHREILQSQLYCQDSFAQEEALERDPENIWLTRMNRQRLGFEAMRDSLLAASHDLDYRIGGLPVDILAEPFSKRRSIYGFIDRQNLPSTFRTFDLASPDAHTPQRLETMVPQQALYMMNGPLVSVQATVLGREAETLAKPPGSPCAAITELYHRLFTRSPDADELTLGTAFVSQWQTDGDFQSAWEAYAHALLSSNEFLFID